MTDINTSTALYGVLGNPVGHSLGPAMHNSAFAHVGFNGVYLAFKVADIKAAVSGIRALDIKGVSITIPHKVAIMEHLDRVDDTAAIIGAVNTVVNENGVLTGFNSDSPGAMAALLEKTAIKGKTVAMIGAGGAARAVGHGIKANKGELVILNRTVAKGEALARDLNAGFYPLDRFKDVQPDIVINTTAMGMTPETDVMPVPPSFIRPKMVVMDIVYNPLETALLKAARQKGCIIVDGVAMFVYQGAYQFEIWTGKKAPVDIMRKIVLNSLTPKP